MTQTAPSPAISLRLLGAGGLDTPSDEDGAAVLARPKLVALLSFLAASTPRGFHRRDTLIGLLWPEMDQERARGALRQSLYHLRRFLGNGVIAARGDEEVALSGDGIECDVAHFEAALGRGAREEALGLYRGHLLEGFFVAGAPAFERWLEQRRDELRRLALRAAWELAEQARDASQAAAAAHWARQALRLAPHDEGVLRQAIGLLDQVGDRAGAVREYETFVRELRDDLDLGPARETESLVEAIRTGMARGIPEPGVRPAAPSPSAAPAAPGDGLPEPRAPRWFRKPVYRHGIVVAAIAIAGVLAVWAATSVGWWRAPDRRQIVVAVFENITGDSTLDPLGRMAADWITQGLDQVSVVEVMPSEAAGPGPGSRGWAGSGAFRALARAAGAGTVVSGRYYLSGDSLRFQARIVDSRTGRLRSVLGPVTGSRGAPSALVDSLRRLVTGTVAALFDARVSNPIGGRAPSFEAYQAYLSAHRAFYDAPSPAQWSDVLLFLSQAIALDSTFLDPRILAGFAYLNAGDHAAADSSARALLSLRPRMTPGQGHLLDYQLALVRGDRAAALAAIREAGGLGARLCVGQEALQANLLQEAVRTLRDAQRLFPTYRQWIALMDAYHLLGEYRLELREAVSARAAFPDQDGVVEARLRAEAALGRLDDVRYGLDNDLPPLTSGSGAGFLRLAVAAELRAHGHRAASFEVADRVIDWHLPRSARNGPSGGSPAGTEDRWTLARAFYLRERWADAEAVVRELASESPGDLDLLGALGVISARRGDGTAAQRYSDSLSGRSPRGDFGRDTYWQARIASLLGQSERAMNLLREAHARGRFIWVAVHADVDFEPLRDYPAFRQFLRSRD